VNGRLLTCVFTSSLLCINAYAVEPDESASVSEQAITAVTESTETDTEVNVEANSEVINQGLAPKAESKSSQILQKLIKLVAESKFALAYQTGLSIHNEWEGDESFDFNFALAAAQTGHYNRAIFPFERLLENNPNNNRYRLELARCHFFLNNYHAAQREFNLVLASNPPAEVQAHIDRFLTRIAEQK
jgi:tetratricopeptide (TPR) repeat protein